MTTRSDQKLFDVIRDAVITVPGVVSFVEFNKDDAEDFVPVKTDETRKAIEATYTGKMYRIRIHIMLLVGVNVLDVLNEVQVRVKYELERQSGFNDNYTVDVAIESLGTPSIDEKVEL